MAYRRTERVQQRLDAQRAAIVQAAIELVSRDGYAGASMARVAGRAGVASGTVYNHFTGKADLLAAVFRAVVSREVAAVRAAAAAPSGAAARVAAVVETFAGRALKAPRLAYALLVEPVDPAVDALRLDFRSAYADVVAAAIRDGVTSGELPPQDPDVVAAALVGAIGEVLVRPLRHGTGEPGLLPTVVTFAQRGIGALDAAHA